MDDKIRDLLALAFRTVPASEANQAITAARDEANPDGDGARSYELLLPEDASAAWLFEAALPKLVYHFESLRARPPSFNNIVLSLFAGEKLHFVRAAEFLPAAARLAGTTIDDLYAKHGTGELRTAAPSHVHQLALAPKTK